MAQSYLGQEGAFYAERQPTDYIDWSKISSDLSKTLDAEAQRRTELKAFLDEENRLAINELQKSPQGEHKGANQFALEYADNGSKYLLMLNKMLKSGQMSVKDYTVAVQNIKDGTNDTFSMLKEYQANFKDIMDRAKNGDNQALELYTSSQIEGYGDFNKSQIYIDPSSGRVSIAMKEKKIVDGKEVYVMTQNPNQIATVSSLRGQLKARYDKFNVDNATDLYVKSLGKEIEAVKAAGGYMNISDVTAKDNKITGDFYKAETDAIHAMLANPLHNSSILTESKKFTDDGKQYGFTYDKAEAERDPSKILLRLDPNSNVAMPDFESTENGRKQMEIATEWIRTQARAKYDKETKFQEVAPRYAPEYVYKRGEEKKNDVNTAMMLGTLYAGDDAGLKAATDYFSNFYPSIKKVTRTPKGVVVTMENEKGQLEDRPMLSFYDESGTKLKTQEQFIKSAGTLFGLKDINTILQKGGYVKGGKFNPYAKDVISEVTTEKKERVETEDSDIAFNDYIDTIPSSIFKQKDDIASADLQKYLKGFGVVVEPNSPYNPSNAVTISIGSGETKRSKTFSTNTNDKDAEIQLQNIKAWLDQIINTTKRDELLKSGITKPKEKPKEQPTGSGAAGDDIFKKK